MVCTHPSSSAIRHGRVPTAVSRDHLDVDVLSELLERQACEDSAKSTENQKPVRSSSSSPSPLPNSIAKRCLKKDDSPCFDKERRFLCDPSTWYEEINHISAQPCRLQYPRQWSSSARICLCAKPENSTQERGRDRQENDLNKAARPCLRTELLWPFMIGTPSQHVDVLPLRLGRRNAHSIHSAEISQAVACIVRQSTASIASKSGGRTNSSYNTEKEPRATGNKSPTKCPT